MPKEPGRAAGSTPQLSRLCGWWPAAGVSCFVDMRLLISSGEPSGELYAAELLRHLKERRADIHAFGLGGDRLLAEGAHLTAHIRDLSVVGLVEVVSHLPRIRRIFRRLVLDCEQLRPALAVLIDYPDFNLRLARALRARGVPVVYYVSPQIWAWRRWRMRTIRATAREMLVIFPFEEALYRDAGVPVSFVGHPLVDHVRPADDRDAFLREHKLDPARPLLTILPGSRAGEVALNLPPLVGAVRILAERDPSLQFAVAAAPGVERGALESAFAGTAVTIVSGRTHALLGAATLGLVASGTATVEAALLGTPMIVVYRVSPLSYFLGRRFVSVPHFAMVNLIAERRIVPELIQDDFNPARLAHEARLLLDDPARREAMRAELAEVRRRLGAPGASARAAATVSRVLDSALP